MMFAPHAPPERGRTRAGRGSFLAAAGLAFLAAGSAGAQEQPTLPTYPPNFAITNARIVTVSGAVIPRGTVVVRDGIITAVGASASIPGDAWRLDADGLTVYPGLIDAFGTLGHPPARGAAAPAGPPAGPAAAAFAAAASGTPRSWGPEDRPATFTWVSAADELNLGDARITSWREAGFTSALTTQASGLLPGQAALINLAGSRAGGLVIEPSVAQRVNLDPRAANGYPGSLLGVFAYLEQLYADVDHYDAVWKAYDANPRGRTRPAYDRALEALRTRGPILVPANLRKEVARALTLSTKLRVPVIIYGGQSAYDATDLLSGRNVPVLVDLDWPERDRNGDPDAKPELSTLRLWEHAPSTPAALHRAGIPFAFTAASLSDPSEARAKVAQAVAAGLPAEAALEALTLGAARILGVADRLGSVEAGKIANLVLVRGDILDPSAKVEHVVIDGQPYAVPKATRPARGNGRLAAGEAAGAGEDEERPSTQAGPSAAAAPVPLAKIDGPYREDAVTLIKDATVLTVTRGTIEGGDVLIRNGKIAQVAENIAAPGGAHVVDARGMFLIPGIIDAHSHQGAEAINEGTVSVSSMVGMKDVIDPDAVGLYRAVAGGVTTINLLHGSANAIGGKNAILKLRWGADARELIFEGAPEGIKFALGENTKRDREPDRYPSTRMGVNDVIRQAFIEARAYQKALDEYQVARRRDRNAIAPRRDLKLEALAEILRGERDVHAHSYRADEILVLIRTAEEFGFRLKTLQHVLEGYKVADEIAAHGVGASTFSDWWAYKVEAWDAIPHNAALMTRRGVVVSINSDDAEEMRHLNLEAAKTMKWGGLTEDEALRLVTLNPAIQLGISDRVGSIEVGKDADLALFKGNPLTMESLVQQTYIDGKLYFDRDLDRERQARIDAEVASLMAKHMPASTPAGAPVPTEPTSSTASTDPRE